jgi:SpoVK/Ycf46/Vps4 family AAA+-type ATPase
MRDTTPDLLSTSIPSDDPTRDAELYLWTETQHVKQRLIERIASLQPEGSAAPAPSPDALSLDVLSARTLRARQYYRKHPQHAPPLMRLAARFHLDDLHLDVLIATLAPHLDPDIPDLFRKLRGGILSEHVDGAALLRLFSSNWQDTLAVRRAIGPQSPLMQNRLLQMIELQGGVSALHAAVAIHPRIIHFALGEDGLHHLIAPFCQVELPNVPLDSVILPSHFKTRSLELLQPNRDLPSHLSAWGYDPVLSYGRGSIILLVGPPGTGKTLLAQALAAHLSIPLLRVFVSKILRSDTSAEDVLNELSVEARLRAALLFFDDCAPLFAERGPALSALLSFLEQFRGIAILATNHAELDLSLERRVLLRLDFPRPDRTSREAIFHTLIPPSVPTSEPIDIPALSAMYDFTGGAIKNTVIVALNKALARDPIHPSLDMALLHAAAESQMRSRLDEFAIISESRLNLTDLILPPETHDKVVELLSACRQHEAVIHTWGFGERITTGRGIICIFDGPPGTGKTFCSEILGSELGLPVSRINIPSVVSKWVGETEQHLQEIFRRARAGRSILLFDEADALFGKRVEKVERATDRYANMEVNLLLQEIERYDGVVLLTTNLYAALDDALLRRILFRVTFPEPDAIQRAAIWRKLIPSQAPLGSDVSFEDLGEQFELTGGRIKNAVLRAAYRARQALSPAIMMEHLTAAAIDELKSSGKMVRDF